MNKFKDYLKPIEPSYWGVDFDIKNIEGEINWLENKLETLKVGSRHHSDIKRQISEKVWYKLLLELNK